MALDGFILQLSAAGRLILQTPFLLICETSPTESDEESLFRLGRDAVAFLQQRDFCSLADRFGYALAFEQNAAEVIERDLRDSIKEHHASAEDRSSVPPSTK